ncbi:MAG: glycosyltransferase family 4 protein [Verrucomicrobiae bacterium]|nr:glycosyltransferase family 4 protein [Verrucomicrobiae bacterium]
MTPRPVLYVHHERALGGAPLSLLYLIRQLDRTKWAPRVLCLRKGPAADLYRKEGLPVRIVPGPDLSHTELVWFRAQQLPRLAVRLLASVPFFFRLRAVLREEASAAPALPLVHLNSSTLAVAAFAAKSLGLPVVWHIREPLARGAFGLRRALIRAAIRRGSDAVVAICEEDATRLGRMPPGRVRVIHNFVDFAQFDAALPKGAFRREIGAPEGAPILLYLGGEAATKGVAVLRRAARDLLARVPDAHLAIAGETGPESTAAWIRAVPAGLRRRVHLLGMRTDVPALLADVALLLFPSTVPHFARPVIEAAAMEVPSVGSDLGGVRELVLPGETGVLIPPSDPRALADVTAALLADAAHRRAMGRKARAWARERFDAKKNAALTFAVYDDLLRARER